MEAAGAAVVVVEGLEGEEELGAIQLAQAPLVVLVVVSKTETQVTSMVNLRRRFPEEVVINMREEMVGGRVGVEVATGR